jgi:hypothetical protein
MGVMVDANDPVITNGSRAHFTRRTGGAARLVVYSTGGDAPPGGQEARLVSGETVAAIVAVGVKVKYSKSLYRGGYTDVASATATTGQ